MGLGKELGEGVRYLSGKVVSHHFLEISFPANDFSQMTYSHVLKILDFFRERDSTKHVLTSIFAHQNQIVGFDPKE